MFDNVIGTRIAYRDYLGLTRTGIIGFVEPYLVPNMSDDSRMVVWVYIVDDNEEMNVHEFVCGENSRIMYADIRLSTEISLITGDEIDDDES